ncbi:CHAT domain-containing protein [Winogradskyella wichelsiae]|uniref:CHAT domain-containing protein n=1 Tax=Winogradskyella wichelsiae TaxID=2697007 RepID=UPI0015CD9199|nr:CHAT domain-containing protein [Winogradskyella wichelsiae]
MKYISFIIPLLCLLLCNKILAQEPSNEALKILEKTNISYNEKRNKLQSLIKIHNDNKEYDFFLADSYELLRLNYKNGYIIETIELNKENLSLMDSLGYKNKNFYRKNLYSLGYYQKTNLNQEEALTTFLRLLDYDISDILTLKSAFFTGKIYDDLEDYYKASEYYNISSKLAKQLGENNYLVRSALATAVLCRTINTNKSLQIGINALNEILALSESLKKDHNVDNDISDIFMYQTYSELGKLYGDRADYDFIKGKKYHEEALKLANKIKDSFYIGNAYLDIGLLHLNDKKKNAEFYFKEALKYKEETNDILNISIVNKNLSRHYLNFKEYDKALKHIQKSISLLAPLTSNNIENLPTKTKLKNSKSKLYICAALIEKSKIWLTLAENNPKVEKFYNESIKTLKLADYIIDESRLESKESNTKLFWRKTATEIYLLGTKASIIANNIEDAFYYIEKSKAILLLEDIALRNIRNNSNIPKTISNKDLELKEKITELENLNNSTNNSSLQRQLLLAKENYIQFIEVLDIKYRLYYKTLQPAEVITYNSFKEKYITKNNAYLQYIIGDERGYGLLITKNESKLFEIEDVETLKALTIRYRRLLDIPFKDKSSIAEYTKVSNSIYNTLFPQEIRTLLKDKKLTISPDNYLQNIPFESLMTSTKERSYLIFENEISYAYSLTFLDENSKIKRNNNNNNNENFVGFAPVNFSSELSQLPNTKEELNSIEKLFSTKMHLNEEATSRTFFKEISDANIIHIASHANANDSISPWIAFHDSKINLNELYNHNTSAELVVLSACNTSLGELYKGEGVMSLSRGFFNTGSHSVLPTLWEVNDRSTVELLNSFYTNLKAGQSKSRALHNAKLKYLETNSLSEASPYYWAGFVLIGDDSPIELSSNFNIYYYLILAVLIGLLVFILKKIKINKL